MRLDTLVKVMEAVHIEYGPERVREVLDTLVESAKKKEPLIALP